MATIIQRKAKNGELSYVVRVRRKGSVSQTATFHSLKDAKKYAQITEGAILEGRHFPTYDSKKYTLGEVIDRYIEEILPQKPPSIKMQTSQLKWWKLMIGHSVLSDISSSLIAQHRDRLSKSGKSNATVNRYLSALSHVLTISVKEWNILGYSPMPNVRKLREPKGRVRFLSDEERELLLQSCKQSHNPYLYTIAVLALSTGARKGELLKLHWKDVDMKRHMLMFRDTKNTETRSVPLTGYALDVLKAHVRVRRIDTPFVFPSPSDCMKPYSINDAWKYAVKRARLVNFRFHDLRHSCASYLAMNGASLLEIGEILGHKTLSMVKRYSHLTEAHTKSVVERMNRAVFEKESMTN
jgi:integrase